MAKRKTSFVLCCNLFSVLLLLLLLAEVIQFPERVEAAGSPVKFLPGFKGPLPFELETGYIGVGDSDDVQLFYYFIKSESNPKSDPLILWLTGGPGCSALSGLIYEIGPITFEPVEYGAFTPAEYNGSFPSLVLNPHTWTKVASFIFLDLPVGTGFSYARTSAARQSDDLQASDHAYQFLHKWLNDRPEFLRNPFYVGGDSYSGIGVPIISKLIANGNEKGLEPFINLKGYLLGNPATFHGEYNYRIPYAHGMGLISDELFESLKRNCKGEYFDIHPSNTQCLNDRQTYDQMLDGINSVHILEPKCEMDSSRPQKWLGQRRSLDDMLYRGRLRCRFDWKKLSYQWAGDDKVREALHVRRGSIGKWKRCAVDALPFQKIVQNSIPYHANLSVKGYRSLIYSGDHDKWIPYISTEAWIRSLNYSIADDWRPWIVDGQVAGYTRTYSNKMTFATVKGGGHTAPEYKPVECLAMLKRWISYQPM
ncbi:serine carboxypeptidase-like 17 [Lycium barbarum]|uniref:serine carboxypeptidase-like 17 n=1 Tax=Lycium barbarum TaxID=112863 RepID=UPI00293E4427|nr:serine carboxypeptidase-like 17 [Lycium barbarum]